MTVYQLNEQQILPACPENGVRMLDRATCRRLAGIFGHRRKALEKRFGSSAYRSEQLEPSNMFGI